MNVKEAFNKFFMVLSEDKIKKLAREYSVEDEQEWKLLDVPFFIDNITIRGKIKPTDRFIHLVSLFAAIAPSFAQRSIL